MIEKTISEIEAKISGAESVSAERKQELLKLLGTLKTEVAKLSKTHGEQADSIAGFAQLSAHEATRAEQNPQLRELSLKACARPSTASNNRIRGSSRSSTAISKRCRIWEFDFRPTQDSIFQNLNSAKILVILNLQINLNPPSAPASQSPP